MPDKTPLKVKIYRFILPRFASIITKFTYNNFCSRLLDKLIKGARK